jgi:hypothetical protein
VRAQAVGGYSELHLPYAAPKGNKAIWHGQLAADDDDDDL